MAKMTITIEDQADGRVKTSLRPEPELPDTPDHGTLAQIIGVLAYAELVDQLTELSKIPSDIDGLPVLDITDDLKRDSKQFN